MKLNIKNIKVKNNLPNINFQDLVFGFFFFNRKKTYSFIFYQNKNILHYPKSFSLPKTLETILDIKLQLTSCF